jgi:hypothetical protein
VGAGLSATFATGDASEHIRAAREAEGAGATADPAQEAAGAAAAIGISPGVAPWVGGRFGIRGDNEAGLTYTGQTVRVDARHAFQNGATALSIGAGISLSSAVTSGAVEISDLDVHGRKLGGDVPILFGWRSAAGIVSGWFGVRGGFEGTSGTVSLGTSPLARSGNLDLRHWYAGGVIGLGFGFRHVHAALELDAYYGRVWGTLAGLSASTGAVTVSPSSALIVTF